MLLVTLEPISNREDWIDQCEVLDQDDAAVDLTTATIVLAVRNSKTKAITLTASTANGSITLVSTGIFQFAFTLNQTRSLCAETYDVGCTINLNSVTQQFFIGTIAVLDGVVA